LRLIAKSLHAQENGKNTPPQQVTYIPYIWYEWYKCCSLLSYEM